MDSRALFVLLDVGYVLTMLFTFAVAATNAVIERLADKSKKASLAFAIVFALFLVFTVYKLIADMTSAGSNSSPATDDQARAFAFLVGQLVVPLIMGCVFAFTNIRWLAKFRAERQRLLKQLRLQALALVHPEAAVTVDALTNVLDKQSRTGLIQSIVLGFFFYVLGVVTPYLIGIMPR